MSIQSTDIIWRPALLLSDTVPAQNGGRMNPALAIPDGIKNNLFPDASAAERSAGSVKWRKAFIHVQPADNTPLLNVMVFIDGGPTPGGDFVVLYCNFNTSGTMTDTQDLIGAYPCYGIGKLHTAITGGIGTTAIHLEVEDLAWYTAHTPFRAGDTLRIADKTATGDEGSEEFLVIDTVAYGSATVDIATTAPLLNSYATTGTFVSACIQTASVSAWAADACSVTSSGGSWASGHPVATTAKGAIDQAWTGTFTSATAFTIAGNTVGTVGTGNTSADTTVNNPANASPYFTLPAAGFSGTFAAGDTFVFSTRSSTFPIWYRRSIPAGCGSLSNDGMLVGLVGESG